MNSPVIYPLLLTCETFFQSNRNEGKASLLLFLFSTFTGDQLEAYAWIDTILSPGQLMVLKCQMSPHSYLFFGYKSSLFHAVIIYKNERLSTQYAELFT